MKQFILSFLILSLIASCGDEKVDPNYLDGQYDGIYQFTAPFIRTAPVSVHVEFNNKSFTISFTEYDSSEEKICEGTYNFKEIGFIVFENSCDEIIQANWASGSYKIRKNGAKLVLNRSEGEVTSGYYLERIKQ